MTIAVTVGSGLTPGTDSLQQLVDERFATRLFSQDSSLWGEDAVEEAKIRLGWVDAVNKGKEILPEIEALRQTFHDSGIDRIVLSGMGGSSLAPEVICARDWARLTVLDSTHPDQVRSAVAHLTRTALVVSSKSGSTVETRSHLTAFEAAFKDAGIDPALRVIVVTDPGSALETYAKEAGYRVFLADPNVGGRYSALTAFGLVPSVLAGADGSALLAEAQNAIPHLSADNVNNPALQLAAGMAAQLPKRYIFGAVETRVQSAQLPAWIEQLLAESTGKRGRGVLPIALRSDSAEVRASALGGNLPPSMYLVDLAPEPSETAPADLTINVVGSLGAQFLLWEVATAALCRIIEVNPFDQPDVESAKAATRVVLEKAEAIPTSASAEWPIGGSASPRAHEARGGVELIDEIRGVIKVDSYIAIQAYLDRSTSIPLEHLRGKLHESLGVPVALGFGPRYLHSTGQFHKGGPANGVYLQIVEDGLRDLRIPGQRTGFSELITAQAKGDAFVLRERDRPVYVIPSTEVQSLIDAL